jgi:hypothetical protein
MAELPVAAVVDGLTASQWLAGDSSGRADALIADLLARPRASAAQLDILEQLRRHVVGLERRLADDGEGRPMPLDVQLRRRLNGCLFTCAQLERAWMDCLARRLETSGGDAPPRVLLLARILDLTARQLGLLIRLGVQPEPALWNRHARLVEVLHGMDMLEQVVPDACSPDGEVRMRALAISPFLLEAAAPWTLGPAGARLTRLCVRAWAARCGIRIDMAAAAAAPRPGPTVIPGGLHLAQLDTQALLASLSRRIERLRAGQSPEQAGLPVKQSAAEALVTLQLLQQRWGIAPAGCVRPEAPANAAVQLLLGQAAADPASRLGPRVRYDFQQMPSDQVTRVGADEGPWLAAFEHAESWRDVGVQDGWLVFERHRDSPRLAIDLLLAWRAAGAGVASVALGRIAGLRQMAEGGTATASTLRIWVDPLPGIVELVLVEASDMQRRQAFRLEVPGQPPCLFLDVGSFRNERAFTLTRLGRRHQCTMQALIRRCGDHDQLAYRVVS